jgi:NADPH:quinone reductase
LDVHRTQIGDDRRTTMRAIRVHEFGDPDVLRLEEVPTPSPVEREVLVRIQAAGVNPYETYVRAGTYRALPALPYTPGVDGAGVVAEAGAGVDLQPGARVYVTDSLSGTYAEYALCRAEDVHPLPATLSYPQGAAIGVPYTTAHHALFQRGGAKSGERLLVHGASGAVGIATVQLALAAGLSVTGTAGSEAGRDLVAAQGPVLILDHHDPGHLAAAFLHTGEEGFDIIIEHLANANLGEDLKALAPYGRVVVVGSRGVVEVNPRDLMNVEGTVVGVMGSMARPEERAETEVALAAGLREGRLRPVVGREMALADAPRAHRHIMARPALGRLVLVP